MHVQCWESIGLQLSSEFPQVKVLLVCRGGGHVNFVNFVNINIEKIGEGLTSLTTINNH